MRNTFCNLNLFYTYGVTLFPITLKRHCNFLKEKGNRNLARSAPRILFLNLLCAPQNQYSDYDAAVPPTNQAVLYLNLKSVATRHINKRQWLLCTIHFSLNGLMAFNFKMGGGGGNFQQLTITRRNVKHKINFYDEGAPSILNRSTSKSTINFVKKDVSVYQVLLIKLA